MRLPMVWARPPIWPTPSETSWPRRRRWTPRSRLTRPSAAPRLPLGPGTAQYGLAPPGLRSRGAVRPLLPHRRSDRSRRRHGAPTASTTRIGRRADNSMISGRGARRQRPNPERPNLRGASTIPRAPRPESRTAPALRRGTPPNPPEGRCFPTRQPRTPTRKDGTQMTSQVPALDASRPNSAPAALAWTEATRTAAG